MLLFSIASIALINNFLIYLKILPKWFYTFKCKCYTYDTASEEVLKEIEVAKNLCYIVANKILCSVSLKTYNLFRCSKFLNTVNKILD